MQNKGKVVAHCGGAEWLDALNPGEPIAVSCRPVSVPIHVVQAVISHTILLQPVLGRPEEKESEGLRTDSENLVSLFGTFEPFFFFPGHELICRAWLLLCAWVIRRESIIC